MNIGDLSEPFSLDLFGRITDQLISHEFTKDTRSIHIGSSFKYIQEVQNLGYYEELNLQVFTVKHSSENDARIGLSKELFTILKEYSIRNALVATYNSDGSWRYSLLTTSMNILKTGKVVKDFSNPRRYSYLLGPKSKTATPYKYLVAAGSIKDLPDLHKRFSVEVVNNEFYKEIARLYDELVGTNKINGSIIYPSHDETSHQFAVRLIGRIVFCWFLREKRSPVGEPLISTSVLSRSASEVNNYYHSVLAPLFFEVLNRPLQKRSVRFQKGDFAKIPYLNGGLFAPQSDDYYKFDTNLEESIGQVVQIPDEWLHKLFNLLELYNFTVDENTSVDVDLSIDPEMLGRIFENLLARINPETGDTVRKSTGSFYTPREIVEFMVDESLIQYLGNNTDLAIEKLKVLVSFNLEDDNSHPLDQTDKKQVVDALGKLKVLDPACGSGAFPIGMLQKIVFILQQVDPDAQLWLEEQTRGMPEVRRQLKDQSLDYIRKLYVIRKSIFGVDIQPIATEIARLRCFLTLIVDESIDENSENRGVKVLPNLDFKFVTANSLKKAPGLSSTNSITLFDEFETELENIVNDYFSAEGIEKAELAHKLRDVIDKKVDENVSYVLNNTGIIKDKRFEEAVNFKNKRVNSALLDEADAWKSYRNIFNHQMIEFFETRYLFPSVTEGFDIVIANPPYGAKISPKDKDKILDSLKIPRNKVNPNSAGLFIDVALDRFLSVNGCLSYIVPKSLLYSEKWQLNVNRIIDNTLVLVDVEKAFEDVKLEQVVFIYNAKENSKLYKAQKFLNENFIRDTTIDKEIPKALRAWLCDVSTEELGIFSRIQFNKTLGDISHTKRGIGLQKDLLPVGDIPVIGGKNISRFKVSGVKGYVSHELMSTYQKKLDFMSKPKLVTQDLVAHIQNPKPHIKLTSAIDHEGTYFGLDTVQNTIITNPLFSLEFVCALLNSKFINWYVYRFIYCSAIRTMHLDNYYLSKIPLPTINKDLILQIENLVEIGDEQSTKLIDSIVYKLYSIQDSDIEIIESNF